MFTPLTVPGAPDELRASRRGVNKDLGCRGAGQSSLAVGVDSMAWFSGFDPIQWRYGSQKMVNARVGRVWQSWAEPTGVAGCIAGPIQVMRQLVGSA